jgi:hypothetical protein
VNVIAGAPQFVSIGTHRGKKENDLLFVVLFIGAQAEVLGHEYGRFAGRRKPVGWKQLVTEYR